MTVQEVSQSSSIAIIGIHTAVPDAQRSNRSSDVPSPANKDACVHCDAFMAYLKMAYLCAYADWNSDTTEAIACDKPSSAMSTFCGWQED